MELRQDADLSELCAVLLDEQARARAAIDYLKQNMLTRDVFRAGMNKIFAKIDEETRRMEEFNRRWPLP